MASLIFAAGILTYDKVKKKREEKKERKRSGYQQRYDDLVRENTQGDERRKSEPSREAQSTGSSEEKQRRETRDSVLGAHEHRKSSMDSQRLSNELDRDSPSAWVDQVLKEKGTNGGGGQEPKLTSLI